VNKSNTEKKDNIMTNKLFAAAQQKLPEHFEALPILIQVIIEVADESGHPKLLSDAQTHLSLVAAVTDCAAEHGTVTHIFSTVGKTQIVFDIEPGTDIDSLAKLILAKGDPMLEFHGTITVDFNQFVVKTADFEAASMLLVRERATT
jgi:hypothetical protein